MFINNACADLDYRIVSETSSTLQINLEAKLVVREDGRYQAYVNDTVRLNDNSQRENMPIELDFARDIFPGVYLDENNYGF